MPTKTYIIKMGVFALAEVRDLSIRDEMKESIKDSGARREFETGAVRDIDEAKGRCDLLPLAEIAYFLDFDVVLAFIDKYIWGGDKNDLYSAIDAFCKMNEWDRETAVLEVSVHYKNGCEKYGERNWEKGIPLHCYIDSGVRHYIKWLRGDSDERHDRAFVWNILGAIWTHKNKPELIDLPFSKT